MINRTIKTTDIYYPLIITQSKHDETIIVDKGINTEYIISFLYTKNPTIDEIITGYNLKTNKHILRSSKKDFKDIFNRTFY